VRGSEFGGFDGSPRTAVFPARRRHCSGGGVPDRPAAGPHAAGTDVPPPPPGRIPVVVCLGHVDIDGGVTAINPPHSGRVVVVQVTEGATVEAAALLLKLDDRPARFEAEQARAAVETAKLRQKRAEQDLRQQPTRIASCGPPWNRRSSTGRRQTSAPAAGRTAQDQ